MAQYGWFKLWTLKRNFVGMWQKRIIIVLLMTITLNSLSLQQILKMPILISHFFEHQQRGPSITFIEFLSMHYWGQDIDDNDDERDMELPFKKVDFSHSSLTLFVEANIELVTGNFPSDSSYTILESENHSASHLGSLFKPPRLV